MVVTTDPFCVVHAYSVRVCVEGGMWVTIQETMSHQLSIQYLLIYFLRQIYIQVIRCW